MRAFNRTCCLWLLIALSSATYAAAETGMCLVVCFAARPGATDFIEGDIRRIDMNNGTVVTTTNKIGTGLFPRFSPDGTRFVYITGGSQVTIANLNGGVLHTWSAGSVGATAHMSWTNTGIYVGADATNGGKFIKYDTLGNKLSETSFSDCNWGMVAQCDTMAAGVHLCCYPLIYHMTSGATQVVNDKGGCSACPSPSGLMVSNNLWLSGVEHQRFRVLDHKGAELWLFNVQEVLGVGTDYYSNILTWSGNGENWMVLPVGQALAADYHQLTKNTSPWVFNVITKEKFQFANRTTDHWQPFDYYSGKIPGVSPVKHFSATNPGPGSDIVFSRTLRGARIAITGSDAYQVEIYGLDGNRIAVGQAMRDAGCTIGPAGSSIALRPGFYSVRVFSQDESEKYLCLVW